MNEPGDLPIAELLSQRRDDREDGLGGLTPILASGYSAPVLA